MEDFTTFKDFHLEANVYLIETEFGGRSSAVFDGYCGQFFWHINDVDSTDWDAHYIFESGQVHPGQCAACKIVLSPNLLKCSKGRFPIGQQFGIREGSKIIGVGTIVLNKVKNA
ncbi:hypothetical protein [Marinibactrum halimedae]|uniref:Translation elongation factor EFTu/EF1A C-terminal domain-containing protein n=1 Tax=Marinibactrum halimedae TaxID=1444977 RepID=A0AA37T612_9GAMM|nr:hypothetical protein [Marinibactrum halimedae]MCD9459449.1 hypothetical protein [Marinibactrum halimedae]GLS28103.1 hypothetical protein GCM10007877_38220 [Marinibactrum halimedae]